MNLRRILIAAMVCSAVPEVSSAQTAALPSQIQRLRPEFAAYFETSFSGSISCHIPQHYSLRKHYDLNMQSKDGGSKPIPGALLDHINSDDMYSVLTVYGGRGIYFRYFGYQSVSNVVVCF